MYTEYTQTENFTSSPFKTQVLFYHVWAVFTQYEMINVKKSLTAYDDNSQ